MIKPTIYTPTIGESITTTSRKAYALAAGGRPCRFTFNGVDMTVELPTTPEAVEKEWLRRFEENAAAYQASPRGLAAAAEREEARRSAQAIVDMWMTDHGDLTDPERAIRFVMALATHVRNDTHWDAEKTGNLLRGAGWKAGDCVGHRKVKTNSVVAARWIVGQALGMLPMPPHQVLIHFGEEWIAKWGAS